MNMTNLTDQQLEDNREFLVGDAVVVNHPNTTDELLEIIEHKYTNDLLRARIVSSGACGPIHKSDIRHATVAELNAKRRLTDAEMALGEVS